MGQLVGETSTGLEPAVSKERLLNGPDLDYLLPGCQNVSASREFLLCFEMAFVVSWCFKTDFELLLLLVLPLKC